MFQLSAFNFITHICSLNMSEPHATFQSTRCMGLNVYKFKINSLLHLTVWVWKQTEVSCSVAHPVKQFILMSNETHLRVWRCHSRSRPGARGSKTGCALYIWGTLLLSPQPITALSQSWVSVNSCMWKKVDSAFLRVHQLSCDAALVAESSTLACTLPHW